MSNLNRLIEMDHEIGKSSSPPKLLKIEDYFWWKERFKTYARFHDIKMWICIKDGYIPPHQDIDGKQKVLSHSQMSENEKKIYEAENRALSCIKMSLPQEILHTFRRYMCSKDLWDALERRYEGSPQVKKGKTDLLKQQFAIFKSLKFESLDDIITRFYHLLTELDSHNVDIKEAEKTKNFLIPYHQSGRCTR